LLNIGTKALGQLAALLNERAGLKIPPDGYHGLKLALSQRMPALGLSDAEEYVRRLGGLAGARELRALLPLVTVGKTDFFRDAGQFRALSKRIIPDLLARARQAGYPLSIWSAGCATGEEPYSLAIVLAESGARPEESQVWATDLNFAAIQAAKAGRFPKRRMQGVSERRTRRFFHSRGDHCEVDDSLRAFIRFEAQNLAAPPFPRLRPESIDLILCRNVIIYFDLPTIRALLGRFLKAIRPNGYLLLGYSESLFRIYDQFEMVDIEGTFVYRRPGEPRKGEQHASGDDRPGKSRSASHRETRPQTSVSPRSGSTSGLGAGGSAFELAAPPDRASPLKRLDEGVRLIEKGQFDEALRAVSELTAKNPDDLAALLTLGNIFSLMGRSGESQRAFAKALAREPLCVEAWLFGGVAAVQAGKINDAHSQLRKALFLEPGLAVGHYLLGQVQERLGDRESARRSYRNAIAQLRSPQRELAGHYPDLPGSAETIGRVARYALSALDRNGHET
jgi:chemotaxis protein methyltransferase CheR